MPTHMQWNKMIIFYWFYRLWKFGTIYHRRTTVPFIFCVIWYPTLSSVYSWSIREVCEAIRMGRQKCQSIPKIPQVGKCVRYVHHCMPRIDGNDVLTFLGILLYRAQLDLHQLYILYLCDLQYHWIWRLCCRYVFFCINMVYIWEMLYKSCCSELNSLPL